MAKKTCLRSDQYSLVVDEMVTAIQKITENNTDINQVTLLKGFRGSVKEKYNDLALVVDDAIQKEYGYNILSNDLITDKKIKPKKLKAITSALLKADDIFLPMEANIGGILYNFQQDSLMVDDEDRMFSNDLFNNIINSGQNIGEAGLSNQITQFISAVGANLTDTQFASVDNKITTVSDFETFYNWLSNQNFYEEGRGLPAFDTESIPGKARIRLLKGYYLGRRPQNKIDREDKNMSVITNIDPDKLASLNGQINALRSEGYRGRELKTKVSALFREVITDRNDKHMLPRPAVSLQNKRPLPAKDAASFHDMGPNAKRTHLINIKDFVTLYTNETDWWSRPNHYTFTEDYLNSLEYMQGLNMLAPLGMVSGSNGNILYANISLADVRDLFPAKHVLAALKDAGYSPAILKEAKKRLKTNTVVKVMRGLEGRAEKYYIAKTNKQLGKLTPEKQADMALDAERFEKAEANMAIVGQANLVKLLRKDDYFTEDDIQVIKDTIVNDAPQNAEGKALTPTIYIPGLLTKIRWYQNERGDDFLSQNSKKGPDPFNLFDRLRINFGKGMATETTGDVTTMLVNSDPNSKTGKPNIYYKLNGKRYAHYMDIPGISGKTNIMDGVTWGSTAYLNAKGDEVGAYKVFDDEHDFRQLKTIESHIARDAKGKYLGYFERKHAVAEGIDGLEIYDIKTDELKASMKREEAYNNEIILYNHQSTGREDTFLDTIGDHDSTKTHSGIYNLGDKSSGVFVLPESSSRIQIAPKSKGNTTASGFVQYLTALNYTFDNTKIGKKQKQALDSYKNVLKEILFTNMRDYLDAFYQASIDADGLWELVQYQFSEEAQMRHTLRDKLNISQGAGIMHQDVLNQLVPQVINTILKEGALKGRTLNPRVANALLNVDMKDKIVGSHYIFVPGRDIAEGTLELSADIATIFNRIKELSGLEDINEINDWLENNPQYVLPYRFPILGPGALQPRRLAKFHADAGQAVYLHPYDTFGTHKGDNDIDSADILLLKEGQAEAMTSVQSTEWFEEKIAMVADIDMLETAEPRHILSSKDTRDTMLDLLHAVNAQGQSTNFGSIASTIGAKVKQIEFSDGIIATPKKLDDIVVMDYIPVRMSKKDFEKKWKDVDSMSLVNQDGTPYKGGSGKKYLQTTFDYEITQITNIAIDNIKTGRLCNMCGARDALWYIDRMFNFNETPSPTHLKLLGKVIKNFNYKNEKNMTSDTKRFLSTQEWHVSLNELDKNLNNPSQWAKNIAASIKDVKVSPEVDGVKVTEAGNPNMQPYMVGIKNISMNKNITLEEEFITEPLNYINAKIENSEAGIIPFDIEAAYSTRQASHYKASNRYLMDVIVNYNISLNAENAAITWAQKFTEDYYGILKTKSETGLGEADAFVDVQAEYNTDLKKVISIAKLDLMAIEKEHGDGASRLASALVLWGVDTTYRKNIPDPNALQPDAYRMYKMYWDEAYNEYDDAGNHIPSTEYTQYGKGLSAAKILAKAKEKRKLCV